MGGTASSQVGFLLVGSGSIARTHASALVASDRTRLVGVTGGSRAETFAAEFRCRHFPSLELALADADVAVVDICGPSGARLAVAEAAAAAGRHVLVEKPIEVTLERADRMIGACDRHGVQLGVIFQSRFKEVYAVVKRWRDRGRFGRLTLGDAYIKWHRPQDYYDSGGWRGTWELDGGGALMNQGIHTIDLLRWLMGEVHSVCGVTATLAREIEVEDTAAAVVRFKSGALGVIEGTTSSFPGSARRLELRGDKGTVVVEDDRLLEAAFQDEDPGDAEVLARFGTASATGSSADPRVADYRPHQMQIEDFARAVQGEGEPAVTGVDARRTLELVLGVYAASRTGRTIPFPLTEHDV